MCHLEEETQWVNPFGENLGIFFIRVIKSA